MLDEKRNCQTILNLIGNYCACAVCVKYCAENVLIVLMVFDIYI